MVLALVMVLTVFAVVVSVVFVQPRWATRVLARVNPQVLFLVDTPRRAVALTIDDGPSREVTPQILERLLRWGARATFFVTGDRVPGQEDVLRDIKNAGCELGNHMMHDRPSILLRPDQFHRELKEAAALLESWHPSRWFRPASGWIHPRMVREAAEEGYRCCLGSIYSHDSKLRHSRWIADFILSRVYPGAIVVIHGGGPHHLHSLEVLDILLPTLRRRGYDVQTVSELLRGAKTSSE
jgi:peptidoglycan/xylan/chitin deacetylase (PgdA/CDA1 family)